MLNLCCFCVCDFCNVKLKKNHIFRTGLYVLFLFWNVSNLHVTVVLAVTVSSLVTVMNSNKYSCNSVWNMIVHMWEALSQNWLCANDNRILNQSNYVFKYISNLNSLLIFVFDFNKNVNRKSSIWGSHNWQIF